MPERIEIAIIPQDLRHEETIVQIAEALDNLNTAVSHIFNSINGRISENSKRLGGIKERAGKLQGRLTHLQTNLNLKAVKMYSAAKYPAMETYQEYKMAIQPISKSEPPIAKIYKSPVPISDKLDLSTIESQIESGQYSSNTNIQEKLQFYYVKSKPNLMDEYRDRTKLNVSSVTSLLPFKTSKISQDDSSPQLNPKEKNRIEDAPDSILQPWHSSEVEPLSGYTYAPTLGEVPQINVPLTLPDLPGIVDDERFVLDLKFQNPIAPSSAAVTPTFRQEQPPSPPSVIENSIPEKVESSSNVSKVTKEPSVAEVPSLPIAPIEKPSATQISPPPPPPPPPPVPTDEGSNKKPEVKTTKESKPVTSTDDRSSLMAAIRDAGGIGRAKLKHAAEVEKPTDRWSSASVGGDLMADLHATLSLRRKGIAGSSINVLARMSSMIPPPPKPNESSMSDRNSATSECESQGDIDDWEE